MNAVVNNSAVGAAFWDELDRRIESRLDKFEQRLEAKLEEKLKPIRKQLQQLSDGVKHLSNWAKRQDESIEREMETSLFKHLQATKHGFIACVPKRFPRNILDDEGKVITDFDGVVVLTSNFALAQYMSSKSAPRLPATALATGQTFLVICEAKQHLTAGKFSKKIKQRDAIMHVIARFRDDPSATPEVYAAAGFASFQPFVGMFFGGLSVDQDARTRIDEFILENGDHELVGELKFSGTRFSVVDAQTRHGNVVPYVVGGGCESKRDRQTVIKRRC